MPDHAQQSRTYTFTAETLEAVAARLLGALGAPTDLATLVGRSLTLSNSVGHDSHGVVRLLEYSEWVRAGQLISDARPTVAWAREGTVVVDGQWGWGQAAAALATSAVIEAATGSGTATVVLSRSNHIGRLGEYVDTIASAGMMGIAFCNTGGALVAPYGGVNRVFGTNPFAWALPGPNFNLVLDFSTAVMAAGKVVLAAMSGEDVPSGAMLDRDGKPTTSAAELNAGGALLPFGDHKGSGLAAMIELAGGLLSGNMPAVLAPRGFGNGAVLMAVDFNRFVNPAVTSTVINDFGEVMHAASSASGPGVLVPGEREAAVRAERLIQGIPVPLEVQQEILALAASYGVSIAEFAPPPQDNS